MAPRSAILPCFRLSLGRLRPSCRRRSDAFFNLNLLSRMGIRLCTLCKSSGNVMVRNQNEVIMWVVVIHKISAEVTGLFFLRHRHIRTHHPRPEALRDRSARQLYCLPTHALIYFLCLNTTKQVYVPPRGCGSGNVCGKNQNSCAIPNTLPWIDDHRPRTKVARDHR